MVEKFAIKLKLEKAFEEMYDKRKVFRLTGELVTLQFKLPC